MKLHLLGRLCLFAAMLVLVSGCDSDPVRPPFSLEDEINANRPYANIVVQINLASSYYTYGEDPGDFETVVAEDGLLVLTMVDGDTEVFNLTTISTIDIRDSMLSLRY